MKKTILKPLKHLKKLEIKKKKIPVKIRIPIIALLTLLVIGSFFSAFATTLEEPKTIEKIITLCNYNQEGRFYYIVYLKNNTVYNKTMLLPNEAKIFKKITDHINASFSYNFNSDCQHTINGSYLLKAQIKTDIWKKEYILIPKTTFNTNNFNIQFPINITHYENIIQNITEEIGITAQNPALNITFIITLKARTDHGIIYEYFTPKLTIPLEKNIIEIKGNLTQSKQGTIQTTVKTTTLEKNKNGAINISATTAVLSLLPLIPFIVFTENDYSKPTETEKQIQKIKKKYSEWIIETDQPPKVPAGVETIRTKSLEDLVKTSEELGKPIVYSKVSEETHEFYVLDENIHYKYTLTK
ncbi:MAG: hypothetical protein DRN24_07200, partial [Thermoplasmata archaeon]